MTIGWRAVVAGWALVLTGCSWLGGGPEDGAGDTGSTVVGPDAAGPALDDAAIAALGLDRLGNVVVMDPGGFVPVPRNLLGPEGQEAIGARHVLRAAGPDGPLDLFEYRLNLPGQGLVLCRAVVERNGAFAGCGPIEADDDVIPLVGVSGGGENGSQVVLDGPAEMSHFMVSVGERQTVLVPVDSLALLVIPGDLCALEIRVAAWRGDEVLRAEPIDLC